MPKRTNTATSARRSAPAPNTRPRSGWPRKNLRIDQRKLDRVKRALGVATETAAVDSALDLVLFRRELSDGLDALAEAGGIEPLGDEA